MLRTIISSMLFLVRRRSICPLLYILQTSCDLGASPIDGNRFSVNKVEEKIKKGFTQRSYTFKESDREVIVIKATLAEPKTM